MSNPSKYYCPRCRVKFLHKETNMNLKHHCGEFARLLWGNEGDDDES